MTTSGRVPSPSGMASAMPPGVPGARRTRGPIRAVGAMLLVACAATAGWRIAGPPSGDHVPVPPRCPQALDALASAGSVGRSPGVQDRLVPMPLPEPRGPVSVRLCAYRSADRPAGGPGGRSDRAADLALWRTTVLDPPRTAALAGMLNKTAGQPASPDIRREQCRLGNDVAVLVFAYSEGPAQPVEVLGGECELVATSARVETGRRDVVHRVRELLG